jgi:hypothetical protein
MIGKIVAYPETSRFNVDESPYEDDCSREVGGCDEGVHGERGICAKFMASRCSEKGNVRDFLDELRTKREELVQVGVV